ncbi:MAG TPA: EpsI family protein, partial [Rhizobacter sp.]|nr:EpsI family protein [Rhizobacter sp.]
MSAVLHLSPRKRAVLLLLAMLLAACGAELLKPTHQLAVQMQAVQLTQQVPEAFADWRVDTATVPVLPDPTLQARLDSVYDQTLARAYVNAKGERVMLTIAYGRDQSSEATAVHR